MYIVCVYMCVAVRACDDERVLRALRVLWWSSLRSEKRPPRWAIGSRRRRADRRPIHLPAPVGPLTDAPPHQADDEVAERLGLEARDVGGARLGVRLVVAARDRVELRLLQADQVVAQLGRHGVAGGLGA